MVVGEIFDALVRKFMQVAGTDAPQLARERCDAPWVQRGVLDAIDKLGLVEGEARAGFVWGVAFEAGALAALRLAGIILSDPAVKGRELEALKLIERGADHAAVLSAMRASKASCPNHRASEDGKVIAFHRTTAKSMPIEKMFGPSVPEELPRGESATATMLPARVAHEIDRLPP